MKKESNMLVLTWKGILMKVDLEQEEGEEFASKQIVLTDPELENHAIMKHTSSYAYFATLTGKIKWLCLSTFQFRHQIAIEGKILALEVLENGHEIDVNVLVCGLAGEYVLKN